MWNKTKHRALHIVEGSSQPRDQDVSLSLLPWQRALNHYSLGSTSINNNKRLNTVSQNSYTVLTWKIRDWQQLYSMGHWIFSENYYSIKSKRLESTCVNDPERFLYEDWIWLWFPGVWFLWFLDVEGWLWLHGRLSTDGSGGSLFCQGVILSGNL